MADAAYKTFENFFVNKGLQARYAQDRSQPGTYLNLQNVISRQENSLSSRYGISVINTDGTNNFPLVDGTGSAGSVTFLARLRGLGGSFTRYAAVPPNLYALADANTGAYSLINQSLPLVAVSRAAGIATYYTSAPLTATNVAAGVTVYVENCAIAGFNGLQLVTNTPTASSFTAENQPFADVPLTVVTGTILLAPITGNLVQLTQPTSSFVYRPNLSSSPYLFITDEQNMLKHGGGTGPTQQMGSFAPLVPPILTAQSPYVTPIDVFDTAFNIVAANGYTLVNATATNPTPLRFVVAVSIPASTTPLTQTITPTFTITTLTRTAGVTTIAVSAAHNIPVGNSMLVAVSGAPTGTSSIGSFNGVFVATATDATHLTFPQASLADGTTSNTGMQMSLMPSVKDGMAFTLVTQLSSVQLGPSTGPILVATNLTTTSFQITTASSGAFTGFLVSYYAKLTCPAGVVSSISKNAPLNLNNFPVVVSNGPDLAATGVNSGFGTLWTNPGNVSSSSSFASVTYTAPGNSQLLEASNFGFSIPSGANIVGLQVTFTASMSDQAGFLNVTLLVNGVVNSTGSKRITPGTTSTAIVLGGTNDSWQTTDLLTPAGINDPAFAIIIQAINNDTGPVVTTLVNNVRVTVYTASVVAGTTPIQPDDYIMLGLNIDNPANIVQIGLYFDVGDGSFTRDYYFKAFAPPGYQAAIAGTQTFSTAMSSYVYQRATGLADIRQLGVDNTDLLPTDLINLQGLRPQATSSGNSAWIDVRSLINDFTAIGAAGTGSQTWSAIVAWKITIQTQTSSSVVIGLDDLYLGGGSGVDSFAGSPYDYRYTYYNATTGYETNPSVEMVSGSFITPQRQPVFIQMTPSLDPQITHHNVYRRGGGLTAEWFKVDQVPIDQTDANGFVTYTDLLSDETVSATNSVLSIINDVPVTAQLQTAVNTTIVYTYPWIVSVAAEGTNIILSGLVPHGLSVGQSIFLNYGANSGTFTVTSVITPNRISITSFTITTGGQATVSPSNMPVLQQPIQAITTTLGITYQSIVYMIPDDMSNIFPNQQVTIGSSSDLEVCNVIATTPTGFMVALQNIITTIPLPSTLQTISYTHIPGEPITAGARQGTPCNISAVAFETAFLAGDPYNPHFLYYSLPENPEVFPPQNFIEVGSPRDPIMGIVEFKGAMYVFTANTIWSVYYSPGGVPSAFPTGTKHGLASQLGWVTTENALFYISYDGIYAFAGGYATLVSEPTEWIWTGKNLGPVAAIDPTQLGQTRMGYANVEEIYIAYTDQTGTRRRLIFSQIYKRWRNDTVKAAAMLFEDDTYQLVIGGVGDGLVYQDLTNADFDSAGFTAGVQHVNPIAINMQTAYLDQGELKAEKNYNELTIDANTGGQALTVTLLFNTGASSLTLGTINTNSRQLVNFNINNGLGQSARNCALQITGNITSAITLYEGHLRGVVEAEFRKSFDSYFDKFGTDMFKIFKQGWFEYSAQDAGGINFSVYLESSATPEFTFNLPQSAVRTAKRVRFPAVKCKIWRMVAVSAADFRLYGESQIEWKPSTSDKGYQATKLAT